MPVEWILCVLVWKRIHFDVFRPSVHTNSLRVFIGIASIWKRSGKWIKTKMHLVSIDISYYFGRSKTVKKKQTNKQNEYDDRKYRRRVCLLHSHRVQLKSQRAILIIFERVSVDSRKIIETVVWTRIDRCVFDDNENAYDRTLLKTRFY